MYKFDIQLPPEVITQKKHYEIDFSLLENKVIIGLMGYSKSGKDFIAKTFIEDYGYKRVAFADNIKKQMNQYLRKAVCDDLNKKEFEEIQNAEDGGNHIKWEAWTEDEIDFFSEDPKVKPYLRPYVMWYGETLRDINGKFCWINKAMEEDAKNMDKIVLSDVRRIAELEIFRNSNEFYKRQEKSLLESGMSNIPSRKINNYGTLLFEVSQMGLRDEDVLTMETIRVANEDWLVDDKFFVNPNIPSHDNYRTKAMLSQITRAAKKLGIDKPQLRGKYDQTNIFQELDKKD